MQHLADRRFLVLLISLFLLMLGYPLLEREHLGRIVFDLLVTLVFLAALFAIYGGRGRWVACLLGLPSILGLWTGYVVPDMPRSVVMVVFHLCAVAFSLFTVAQIFKTIQRDPLISMDKIYGALCGYLMLGLAFSHLFSLADVHSPNAFKGDPIFESDIQDHRRHYVLLYFSFVTLSSLGYGDVVPASPLARGLAVVEVLLGQFYLAVLVGELIGKRVAQVLADQPRPPQDNAP
jgi:hypothetical protein